MPIYTNPKTEYEEAKKLLVKALNEKRKVDSELVDLERAIHTYEGAYLTDTQNSGGNIMQGFENFLKPSHASKKRLQDVGDGDRLFSSSSATYRKALQDDKTPTPARTSSPSPSVAGGTGRTEDGSGKKGVGRGKAGAMFGKRPSKRKAEEIVDENASGSRKKRRADD